MKYFGWVLITTIAAWTAWPLATTGQSPSESPHAVRISPLIERLEQGGVVGPDVWQMIDMEHGLYLINELRARLNEFGEQGWELISVAKHDHTTMGTLVFRRQVE